VPDYISIIGYLAMVFLPLYIPIAVTIIGGIRRRRQSFSASPVVEPAREVARSAHRDRVTANARSTAAAAPRVGDGVLAAARPVVEPV
jgi:hypothetical protein